MKKLFSILLCLATFTALYAQDATTEELLSNKNPMDRTVQTIVPENQRITVNPVTGKPRPASVRFEYIENYDEVHAYYTCLDVAYDQNEARVTLDETLDDFRREHEYVKFSHIRRPKSRHYKDDRGIKMAEMLCVVKFYR